MKIHQLIKKLLGYESNTPDKKILGEWKNRTSKLCKSCWELHYCPYGPIVEGFPLFPPTREEAISHNEYLKKRLETGKLENGDDLDIQRRKWFQTEINNFNPQDYPESIPQIISEASCRVFGHVCPAFFVSEPLTETKERRKHSRLAPRDVMLKVVRRDGQICQNVINLYQITKLNLIILYLFQKVAHQVPKILDWSTKIATEERAVP